MKKPTLLAVIMGSVLLCVAIGVVAFYYILPGVVDSLINRSLDFPEKSKPSFDGKLELRQYSKDAQGVSSLYFYITKAGDKNPLFVSDCEYRLFDFQHLEWGVDSYDVWAVSGDIGTFCYLYQDGDKWVSYSLDSRVQSTDESWLLDKLDGDGATVAHSQIERSKVPKEVISYLQEWETKE